MIGLGYFLVVPLTLLVLNGGYSIPTIYNTNSRYSSVDLTGEAYLIPVLIMWGALLLTFALIIALKPVLDANRAVPLLGLNEQKLKKVLLLTFGIALADYVIEVWMAGGLESFLFSHWYLRQEDLFTRFADRYVVYTYLSQGNHVIFLATSALYTASLLQQKKWDWRFAVLLVFALILQMVMTGNRIFIASFGLAFLASCWIYGRRRLIFILLVLLPAMLLFFSAWAHLRGNLGALSETLPTFLEEELGNRTMVTLMDTTEGPSVMQLLHVINDFGYKFDYLYGSSYAKAILFVVPRSIYPTKSSNFPVLLAQLYEPGEVTSLGGTQFAEMYGNFGIFSMILLPVVTFLILSVSEQVTRRIENRALLSAVSFLLCIWFARSSFEDNFITFLFAMFLIWALRLRVGPRPAHR
jgi:oligosaccharide repeat unit polymerase